MPEAHCLTGLVADILSFSFPVGKSPLRFAAGGGRSQRRDSWRGRSREPEALRPGVLL